MIRSAILGASGYVGGELMRLLAGHPAIGVAHAFAASNAGQPVTAVHPALALAYPDQRFAAFDAELLGEGTPAPASVQPPASVAEKGTPAASFRSSPIIDLTLEDDSIVSANSPRPHPSPGAQEEEQPILVDSIEVFEQEPEAGGNCEVQTSESEQVDEDDATVKQHVSPCGVHMMGHEGLQMWEDLLHPYLQRS